MVTVTKQNFLEESNSLIQKLPSAAYVSIDLEMTGIGLPNSSRPNKSDTPSDRFTKLKEIPERYSIIQIGVAVFHENPKFRRFVKNHVSDDHDHDNPGNDGNGSSDDNDDNDGDGPKRKSKRTESTESDESGDYIVDTIASIHRRQGLFRESNNLNSNFETQDDTSGQINNENNNDNGNDDNNDNGDNDNGDDANRVHQNNDDDNDHDHDHDNRVYQHNVDFENNNQSAANDNGGDDGDSGSVDAQHGDGDDDHGDDDHVGGDGGDDGGDDSEDEEDDDSADSNDGTNQDQEPPEFLVYKYNFYLFPAPQSNRNIPTREVTMNPASIAFLIEQEMDFSEWVVNGIPYTTLDHASTYMEQFNSKYEMEQVEDQKCDMETLEGPHTPPPLADQTLTDPNEVAFIARSMANLREWIDSAAPPIRNISGNITLEEEERLGIVKLLPPHKKENLRKCLFRKIKYEYPSLHWYKHNSQNYVLRLSEDEKKVRDERIKRVEWQKMHTEKIGFARVFKAISDACRGELGDTEDISGEYQHFLERSDQNELSLTTTTTTTRRRVPIVVHNGFMDLLFLMTHFHSHKLPSKYADTKELIHNYFPIIYDTKVLATECADFRFRSKNSSLSELYQRHVMGIQSMNEHEHTEVLMGNVYPRVEIMNDLSTSNHRDAGDDAFMTGAVFQCISRPIINHALLDEFDQSDLYFEIINEEIEGVGSLLYLDENYSRKMKVSASLFGVNKLFIGQSIFTVNLDKEEDLLKGGYSKSTIFRVSNLEEAVSYEEINDILSKIRDPQGGKVPYEIILKRADDSNFIVAARIKSPRSIHASMFVPSIMNRLAETLERHGFLIRHELEKHFRAEYIISMEEYLNGSWPENNTKHENTAASRVSNFVSGVFEALGFSNWYTYKHKGDEGTERKRKRRRLDS